MYNQLESESAGRESAQILAEISRFRENNEHVSGPTEPPEDQVSDSGGDSSGADHFRFPDIEMPVVNINGVDYIGTLSVPALGIELPVAADWNYPQLQKTPCRYHGSAYKDGLVLCAHNYQSHFGKLDTLNFGDKVIFTDMAGNVFEYEVADIEELNNKAVADMIAGDYALTLLTCTLSGMTRVTVRCVRAG